MAKLLTKKFIGNKEIDGEKIKLLSGQSLKAETTSGTEVELLKVDGDGKVFAMGSEVGKKSEIDQVASDLSNESSRAIGVEVGLQTQITQEIADRSNEIQGLSDSLFQELGDINTALAQEISDRTNADASLQSQIDALSGSSGSSLAAIEASLTQEIADRVADVNAEESRAMAAESSLSSAISQEVTDRQSAVSGVQSQIDAIMQGASSSLDSFVEVVQAFQAADNNLNGAITSLASAASAGLATEEARAMAAESAIASNLSTEITNRTNSEAAIYGALSNETTYRNAAVQAVQDNLTSEVSRATSSESALSGRIAILEGKVFEKEKKTLSSSDISNGFVMLSHQADAKSIVAFVDRLGIHEGEDYTVSVVNGMTKITFAGDIGPSGVSPLEAGDTVYFKYHY